MNGVAVLGAGAFGTALALVLARSGREVTLWARDARPIAERRESPRLPGVPLPETLAVTGDLNGITAQTVLLAVPMQALAGFLDQHATVLNGRQLVGCSKGIDLATGLGPSALIRAACPAACPALISGPGFAADLAAGLPTALTLACDAPEAPALQDRLSGDTLRLYLSTDLTGVELGGAVKNVIAIACGIVIGAGLGESARAALLTRGYAEMLRYAVAQGAQERTLAGLSGLGDLVLTSVSEKSRNFRHGLAIGRGTVPDASVTVEGVATARALDAKARQQGIEMPVTSVLAAVLEGRMDVAGAMRELLARPLKAE
ncbi:NAD(P)H-dependent glycerol-3-phosphate dehydrogenase [Frigidibacter sp. ROC022]|uniref:NAD(P)H-dependent glycerol-3-phosphate dehydrogenase n=1 Tax=Frigidibacter sp. ROC022 TaxID=2971796 RepID=UPI00215B42E3|nr:NAD(P)H-dependent glycerol-3-phosphate dehydrogenase [Frigidibacter sp. ROC022]MCR8724506.1 NAD(P)-dependent glycerol-3-phosphate dehydrogenase [Frigidibacter sp. ROC022]